MRLTDLVHKVSKESRSLWRMSWLFIMMTRKGVSGIFGTVEELIMGRDDEVHGAVIRGNNKNKSKLLRGPVQRLYLL